MADFLKLLGSGALAGVLSPLFLAYFQHVWIWKAQKLLEMKKAVFDEAVQGLAMYEADAMSIDIQKDKPTSAEGIRPHTFFRPETQVQLSKSLAGVEAFFSPSSLQAYQDALSSGVSLGNIPNEEFSRRRTKALRCMATDLGIAH